jgi:hypothetical protein
MIIIVLKITSLILQDERLEWNLAGIEPQPLASA